MNSSHVPLAAYSLDDTDRRILEQLDEGSYCSQVARRLDLAKSTISTRMSRLEEAGLIEKQGSAGPGNPQFWEVAEGAKERLEREGLWGHKSGAENLRIVIQKAQRRFSVFGGERSERSGRSGTGSVLWRALERMDREDLKRLPGRFDGSQDWRNWTKYRFLFRGWALEVTTKSVLARPLEGLEVPVGEAGGSEWPVREVEERGAAKAAYVAQEWVSGVRRVMGPELGGPVNLNDEGWSFPDREYALAGLSEEETEKLKVIAGNLKLPAEVGGKLFVDSSGPGSSSELETADRATAEGAVKAFVEGARSSSMVEQLVMDVQELKSEVSRNGGSSRVERDLQEIRERQEALAASVSELVGMLKASGQGDGGEGSRGPGPMFR